ncbi:murein DD-endopeptidase MepM [Photobacterium sp. GJ3]|uniref:murein DD-endopeptidase MepM n=1 Tax=Photobacterium sp. GJ3 TaxID=2829502 RepID=UPI001B8AC23E|nr:murein DD-endopeptidase MepM [Photobacterium sp. GJ3]QUJ68379.1 murein DD-endopeptidase MepM [Photobacterium sp. GJ3]
MKILTVAARRFSQLPRQHRIALASTSLLVAAAFVWQPNIHSPSHGSRTDSDSRREVQIVTDDVISLSDQNSEPLGVVLDPEDPDFQIPKDELEQQLDQATDIAHVHRVASGETLGEIFTQYALPLADMYRLIEVDKSIQFLRVGQAIEWSLDEDGRISELSIERSPKFTDTYVLSPTGYTHQEVERTGEFKPVRLTGRVSGSFYQSARAAGLSPTQIQTLVKALQWRFDLGKDARKGDRFAITLEREFIDGKAVGQGEVKALYYLNGSNEVFAMRYDDGEFYDEDGRSLNRALNRYPTQKRFRISSSFDPHRKHPITHRVSPHNGTDFATPIGTPVLATGDGVVVKAQKHPLAGNFIMIKHGREYSTRYLHLSKILVKKGQKVRMGDRIALSGNTGRSTGPHLHYELLKYNRAVNAMKVPLPQAEPVPNKARSGYRNLANRERQNLLAVMPG